MVRLYEPLHTLKKVAENIWIVDGGKIEMSFVLTNVPFSTRMTVVRLQNGDLWCHSPIQLNDQLIEEMNAIGTVKHLISPNKIHYAFIQEWQTIYPDAVAWASPGVEIRAQKQGMSLTFDEQLQHSSPNVWKKELDQLIFDGSFAVNEVVFFHKNSRTLILTDLIENIDLTHINNGIFRNILKIAGTAAPNGRTPIDYRLSFFGNKKKARKHLSQMIKWNPERIILAHGDWFQSNGKEELLRAFSWVNGKGISN